MTLKCLKYTQLPAETILLYLRVNRFMRCKNLTSPTATLKKHGDPPPAVAPHPLHTQI